MGKLFHITELHKNSRVTAAYRKKRLTVDVLKTAIWLNTSVPLQKKKRNKTSVRKSTAALQYCKPGKGSAGSGAQSSAAATERSTEGAAGTTRALTSHLFLGAKRSSGE